MFEKFGGGELTSAIKDRLSHVRQTLIKEQKHEFYPSVICLVTTFHLMYFKLTQP